jgi:hypothetical protein
MKMFYSDDPAMDEMRHTRALDILLEKRPKCHCCKRHIQDDEALHYTEGREEIWLCLDCVEDMTEFIED